MCIRILYNVYICDTPPRVWFSLDFSPLSAESKAGAYERGDVSPRGSDADTRINGLVDGGGGGPLRRAKCQPR